MPLQLRTVSAARGARWVVDALRVFARRPLALTLMFMVFFAASSLVVALLPLVGSLLQLAALPLLSLGFMVATQSALLDGPVSALQFVEPLRGDAARRGTLLRLCALYGVLAFALLALAGWVSDDALLRLQEIAARPGDQRAAIEAVLAEPGVTTAGLLLAGGGAALSVPFWHAPALVHWGGQGLAQALFSSTLAIWRTRGAFAVYLLTWLATTMISATTVSMLLAALGAGGVVGLFVLPVGLVFSTVFYVSLLFTFNDSFGGAVPSPGGEESPPPE